jgi:hypothetical protein
MRRRVVHVRARERARARLHTPCVSFGISHGLFLKDFLPDKFLLGHAFC